MDESCGPARALRAVCTARGQRLRVAHRLPTLSRLSPTIPQDRRQRIQKNNRTTLVLQNRTVLFVANTLTNRLLGQHMLDEVGGGLRHESRATAWTEAAALATERHQLLMAAGIALDTQESVFEAPAFQGTPRPLRRRSGRARHRSPCATSARWTCGSGSSRRSAGSPPMPERAPQDASESERRGLGCSRLWTPIRSRLPDEPAPESEPVACAASRSSSDDPRTLDDTFDSPAEK